MKSCTVDFPVCHDFRLGEGAVVDAQRVVDACRPAVNKRRTHVESGRREIDCTRSLGIEGSVFVEHHIGRGFFAEVCDDVPVSCGGYRIAPVGVYVGDVAEFEQRENRRTYMGKEAELVCGAIGSVVYPVESRWIERFYEADDFNGELPACDRADSGRRIAVYDIRSWQDLVAGWCDLDI